MRPPQGDDDSALTALRIGTAPDCVLNDLVLALVAPARQHSEAIGTSASPSVELPLARTRHGDARPIATAGAKLPAGPLSRLVRQRAEESLALRRTDLFFLSGSSGLGLGFAPAQAAVVKPLKSGPP